MAKDTKKYFKDLFGCYGEDEKSLGWSKKKQYLRFEQLMRFLNPNECSILDLGCGFGDLARYIHDEYSKKNIQYIGVDFVEEFIDIAKKNGLEKDQFYCMDFINEKLPKVDFVVASGIFGHKLFDDDDKNYDNIRKIFSKALDCCEIGIAVDFLSDKVDFHSGEEDFHASPEKIMSIAYEFSRNIILDNSVMPFEFSITIFKDDSFITEKTVFCKYLNENNK